MNLLNKNLIQKGSSGVAKIVIDELVLYWYPGGNYPLAIL